MDTDILILKDLNEVLVTWQHKWIDNIAYIARR